MLDCVNKLAKNQQRKQVMNPLNQQPLQEKPVRISIPDELYRSVLEAAQKAGVSTEEFLRMLLREKLLKEPFVDQKYAS